MPSHFRWFENNNRGTDFYSSKRIWSAEAVRGMCIIFPSQEAIIIESVFMKWSYVPLKQFLYQTCTVDFHPDFACERNGSHGRNIWKEWTTGFHPCVSRPPLRNPCMCLYRNFHRHFSPSHAHQQSENATILLFLEYHKILPHFHFPSFCTAPLLTYMCVWLDEIVLFLTFPLNKQYFTDTIGKREEY